MSKKFFINYLVITAMVITVSSPNVYAKNNNGNSAFSSLFVNDEAFKHLGIGLEIFSFTGFGIELATPVNSHFTLRGGLSLLPLKYNTTMDMPMDENILKEIQDKIDANSAVKNELAAMGVTQAIDIKSNADVNSTLGLVNGKLLVDIYPSSKRGFHLTGGLFFGKSDLLSMKGTLGQAVDVFTVMEDHGYTDFSPFMDEFDLSFRDIKDINAALSINSIKPYLGIGFGRAIPRRFINLNFEMGALFWGTPQITSKNENIQKLIDSELGGMNDIMKKLKVYPVLSLKLNFKAF